MSPLIKHLLTVNKKSDILDYKRQLKLKKSDFFDFFEKIMIFINPACWSTKLERQTVHLALRIFNVQTAAAIQIQNSTRDVFKTQTEDFIRIVCSVWKIFNINTPTKGLRLRDSLSLPLTYNDSRFLFLSRVAEWLEHWKKLTHKIWKIESTTFTGSTIVPCVLLR